MATPEEILELEKRLAKIAPELIGLSAEKLLNPLKPSQVGWEVIDAYDFKGDGFKRITEIKETLSETKQDHKLKVLPYEEAVKELLEHAKELEQNSSKPEKMIEEIVAKIMESTTGLLTEDVKSLVSSTEIAKDIAWLSDEFRKRGLTENKINEHSVYLHNLETGELIKWVDEETHELLQMARMVGLIPFETIRKLRDLKIVVAGASASARTVDLLVALGAKNIQIWDNGKVSPVKLPLYPGSMGSINSVGQYKSVALKRQAVSRSPFMNFNAHTGLVLKNIEGDSHDNISFEEFIKDADLVIECVDAPHIKTQLRLWLAENYPDLPVLFLADIGNKSVAGMEIPGKGQHYHQELSQDEIKRMQIPPKSLGEALAMVYRMLKKEIPPNHLLQFVYYLFGISNAWSQTSIAAVDSSIISAKLVLAHLQGRNKLNNNFDSGTAPDIFTSEMTERDLITLRNICEQKFILPF